MFSHIWQALVRTVPALIVIVLITSHASFSAESSPPSNSNQSLNQTVVFIGDSITAGYGVKAEQAFPERAQALLTDAGYHVKVINGGISGGVTSDADRLVRWFLKSKPDLIVLELGGNDGLKGTPIPLIKKNLAAAIDVAKQNKIQVLLVGMQIYANLGAKYTKDFAAIYPELAKEKNVKLMPFLLEGVALKKELNQADGKHPNEKGHDIIAKNIVKEIEPLLNFAKSQHVGANR